jgi:hypothetical protein
MLSAELQKAIAKLPPESKELLDLVIMIYEEGIGIAVSDAPQGPFTRVSDQHL